MRTAAGHASSLGRWPVALSHWGAMGIVCCFGVLGQPQPTAAQQAASGADDAARAPLMERTRALEWAVENNYGIRIARTNLAIARRNVSVGNAGFLPDLSAVASQNRLVGGPGLFGRQQVFSRTELGLRLNWVAFAGLGRFATYDRLEATYEAERLRVEADVESVLVDVSTAYWNVVRQQQLLEAVQESQRLSQQRVDIAEQRLEAGVGSQLDANLARVELYQDRSAVAEQRIALTASKTRLNRLLGRAADTPFRARAEFGIQASLRYERLRQAALERNRRLRVARQQKQAAAEAVAEARAERWPTVGMDLGYVYQGFHDGFVPPFDVAPGLQLGVSIDIPLFRGFNIGRQVQNAVSRANASELAVQQERTRVDEQVRNAYAAYRQNRRRVQMTADAVRVAEQNVDIALTQMQAGTISQIELRQVQLDLLNARTRHIAAKFETMQAQVELGRLSGRLYEELL